MSEKDNEILQKELLKEVRGKKRKQEILLGSGEETTEAA